MSRRAMRGMVLLALVTVARAEERAAFPAGELVQVLRARVGTPTRVYLASGTQFAGKVGEVREHEIVLLEAGREHADLLIRLDRIDVVEASRDLVPPPASGERPKTGAGNPNLPESVRQKLEEMKRKR